jgi:hypothetical protein
MELDFKPFIENQGLDKQRILFEECFPETIGTTSSSQEHYRWKFHSKSGEMAGAEYCVNEGGDMIGYYAAIPYYYTFQGKTLRSAMVCDVMTGIKARGKGVFTKLGEYSTNEMKKRGFDLTTGYPIRPEVIPGHLKVGWKKTIELPLFGRFIRFDSFLRNKRLGILAPFINLFYSSLLFIYSKFTLPRKGKFVTTVYTSEEIDKIEGLFGFYDKWQSEIPIGLNKDNNFLKWRLGAPGQKYYLLVLKENSNIIGVLIAREVIKENVPCMGVLDIALLNGYHRKANILLNELISLSTSKKRELVLVMMSNFWSNAYGLKKSLFWKTPFKFFLITKNLSGAITEDEIMKEPNWHVMWIDSDNL